ncbi:MAG: preprotein translocase subunit YajC [Verrucomicrobia bacterium]|jgi:preprotein translocase subunit YajC|nr:MAG: preprotein translocase subunit YajC [Verrucomicrobiota bacterium]MDH4470359.1 preprotein translocase subunit YajC [Verrucomicrobiae bacterium]
MQLLVSLALAQAAPAGTPPAWAQYAPLIFIGIIFYFLLIRPQQKQRKAHVALITALKTGDKIVTSSGIHGMITNVKDRTFLIKIADTVKIEVDKSAIVGLDRDEDAAADSK